MTDAVIFDFDGIIVDTEPLHFRAFLETLSPEGLPFTWAEYKETALGLDDRDVIKYYFRRAGRELSQDKLRELTAAKAALFKEAVAQTPPEPYPGVAELLAALSGRGVPLAVCSGARQSDIDAVFAGTGLASYFQVIVSADDVARSKPDPDCYRLTVKKLQTRFPAHALEPGRCFAIEDSPAGISSALAAGLRVLAVTNSYSESFLRQAHQVVASLADPVVAETFFGTGSHR
jgi:beta-phosphoglucomutase